MLKKTVLLENKASVTAKNMMVENNAALISQSHKLYSTLAAYSLCLLAFVERL